MTVFGDLEVSVLTELPAGRSPITTHVVPAERPAWTARMWGLLREQVAAGHQAYVVCPRIDGDGDGDDVPGADDGAGADLADGAPAAGRPGAGGSGLGSGPGSGAAGDGAGGPAAVVETLDRLRGSELAGLRVEALHGRLPAEARDKIMVAFAAGEIDVLVATTVIEVGVNVPNATVMIVLDADRFGVSQLHQLRGRIGRGEARGWALLHTRVRDDAPAFERLTAIASTLDGARLALLDLAARREGDVLGVAQSGGRRSLRMLALLTDEELIGDARTEATALVAADPELTSVPELAAALARTLDESSAAYLEKG
jgi:ATP-dependent DNA helicase RecG